MIAVGWTQGLKAVGLGRLQSARYISLLDPTFYLERLSIAERVCGHSGWALSGVVLQRKVIVMDSVTRSRLKGCLRSPVSFASYLEAAAHFSSQAAESDPNQFTPSLVAPMDGPEYVSQNPRLSVMLLSAVSQSQVSEAPIQIHFAGKFGLDL
ncbi:hypothetical protein BC567DRAFT_245689 [Phyllosticta citribraziliensis]